MIQTEVIIVGGGPAGSACAKRLRELGVDCLILDREAFPRPKPCAGWVTPQVFKHLGASPEDYPYGLTHFDSFQISLKGIKFRLPTHQYAIRRLEFDAWLLDLAGAEIVQHQVMDIQQNQSGFTIDDKFYGKYLVGAGGTYCPVRRKFFNAPALSRIDRLILAKEEEFPYQITDNQCYLWFFEDGLPGYAWYVPKTGGFLNIGIGASAAGLKRNGRTLNDYWEQHIHTLEAMALVRGHPFQPAGYSYFLHKKKLPEPMNNVLLVGDALGLATRDMGEGIGPAIQSGILAAEAIRNNAHYDLKLVPRFSFPSLFRWR